jgi:polysaccharide biosynthesis transport protein
MNKWQSQLPEPNRTPAEITYQYPVSRITQPPGQLQEYWSAISRNLVLVCALTAAGTLAGFGAALLQHPLFRARTVLDIRSLNENVLNRDTNNSTAAQAGLPESYLQTEIKILQSDTVLKRAVAAIPKAPPKAAEDRSLLLFNGIVKVPERKLDPIANLVADAANRVKIRALGTTRMVEILCDARDGQIAAAMCNSISGEYIKYNLESRLESTKETGTFLSSQLENVRLRLSKSEEDLQSSAHNSGLPSNAMVNPTEEQVRRLQDQLSRTQAERIDKESLYETVKGSGPDALPRELDNGPIRDYRLRLNDLRRQLAEKRVYETPEHNEVRQLQAEITEVESSLEKERRDLIARLRTDYESTLMREEKLTSAYQDGMKLLSQQGDKTAQAEMLSHDVDSTRKLYETLLQRVYEVNLANAMRASSISVVDQATAPTVPYSPKLPLNIGIGFFVGLCMGFAIAIVRSDSDQTIRDPGDTPTHVDVRQLGVIPAARNRFSGRRPDSNKASQSLLLPDTSTDELFAQMNVRRDQVVELTTWRRDQPAIAEAFCCTMNSFLLAQLRQARGPRGPARAVVVTSPESGDGKTAVVTNLAIALSRAHRKVLLVDGDMRRPRLHKIFDLQCGFGLDSILSGAEPIAQLQLSNVVATTKVRNLSVLPTAVVKGGRVSDLLHSDQLPLLIERLRQWFDFVLIDTPPMQYLSDARVFASHVDGALLVFRAGKTTRDAALAAQDCLRQDGVAILGTILNDWKPRRSKAYSQYKRQYSYN